MRYGLVWGYTPSELEESVNRKLEKGWQLQGGVAIALESDDSSRGTKTFAYYQAITGDEAALANEAKESDEAFENLKEVVAPNLLDAV